MKAAMHDTYGVAAVALGEAQRPTPGKGEVLIEVAAAGVNPADSALAAGLPYVLRLGIGLRSPRNPVPGTDVAGTVVEVGAGAAQFAVGDRVFGAGRSTFAEFAVAKERSLWKVPSEFPLEQAASLPMAGCVATQATRDHMEIGPGVRVLVNGAAGGIGHLVVQIAAARGAEVTGVCSGRNADLVRSLGAAHVIDYTVEDFTQGSRRYDVILDNVGNHSLRRLRTVLAERGRLIPNGGGFDNRWFASGGRMMHAAFSSIGAKQNMRPILSTVRQTDLEELAGLCAAGQLAPVIERAYPLAEASAALAHVAAGHTRGKVVVTVAG